MNVSRVQLRPRQSVHHATLPAELPLKKVGFIKVTAKISIIKIATLRIIALATYGL